VSGKHEVKTWLIGYDIADPKRLRHLHRYVSKVALRLQYSAYCLDASDEGIEAFLLDVSIIMEPAADDIRIYHLPKKTRVWTYGVDGTTEGVLLSVESVIDRFLLPEKKEKEHSNA
jgi:CRISPR-associated protein Cas2